MDFDFGQHTTVDTLDKVPEQFRALYGEGEDSKFSLKSGDDTVKGAVEAILGLNRALKASRAEAKDAKGKAVDLSALGEYGESVEEISAGVKTKLEELQRQLTSRDKAKVDIDKIKEDIAKAHSRDLEAKETRIGALTNQLYGLLVESNAKSAISKEKGDVDLLLPFVKEKVKVIEEDGEFKVFVVDEDQNRRYSGVTGEAMTIGELVQDMKKAERYQKLFDSETPSGSGHLPGSSKVPATSRTPAADLSSRDKISLGLAKRGYATK